MAGEQTLIERITRAIGSGPPRRDVRGRVRLAIGDDAALLRPAPSHELVLTCDAFLENAHFLADVHPPDSVGYKALARATSDLAAMGAKPLCFLLTLALPPKRAGRWLDAFLKGMSRAARRFHLTLAGGDTASHSTVAIDVTVLGEIREGMAVTRAGARPGDAIYVSGKLGRAQLGLELVLRGLHRQRRWRTLLQPHLYPEPRLALGEMLASKKLASAMIDTSDGLSTDLSNLCDASRVGAELWLDRLPAVRVPPELLKRGLDPVALALHGGEDYELLFTVPRRLVRSVPSSFRGVPLTQIGRIVKGKAVSLVGPDGRARVLPRGGWDHFRNTRRPTERGMAPRAQRGS
jgi:thiamine-monophosphate kinase